MGRCERLSRRDALPTADTLEVPLLAARERAPERWAEALIADVCIARSRLQPAGGAKLIGMLFLCRP